MGHTEELLTEKSFTRDRALALLQEFSRSRIATWLKENGHDDRMAELVEPYDSLMLAFLKVAVLSTPFGGPNEQDLAQREFHKHGVMGAFLVKLRPELIAANLFGKRTPRDQADHIFRSALSLWVDAIAGWPKKGRYFDRQQVLGLLYIWIAPGYDDAERDFHSAARIFNERTGEKLSSDEFFWEFLSARRMTRSQRYLIRRADGWQYVPGSLAGIVSDQAEKERKPLTFLQPGALEQETELADSVEDALSVADAADDDLDDALGIVEQGRVQGVAVDAAVDYIINRKTTSREAVAREWGCSEDAIRHAEAWLQAEGKNLKKSRAS